MAAEWLTDGAVTEIFGHGTICQHSAATNFVTGGLAIVTRNTAGSETLENHVYDDFWPSYRPYRYGLPA